MNCRCFSVGVSETSIIHLPNEQLRKVRIFIVVSAHAAGPLGRGSKSSRVSRKIRFHVARASKTSSAAKGSSCAEICSKNSSFYMQASFSLVSIVVSEQVLQLNTSQEREPWRGRSASEASPFSVKESVGILFIHRLNFQGKL